GPGLLPPPQQGYVGLLTLTGVPFMKGATIRSTSVIDVGRPSAPTTPPEPTLTNIPLGPSRIEPVFPYAQITLLLTSESRGSRPASVSPIIPAVVDCPVFFENCWTVSGWPLLTLPPPPQLCGAYGTRTA